jgi:hypothetical protein
MRLNPNHEMAKPSAIQDDRNDRHRCSQQTHFPVISGGEFALQCPLSILSLISAGITIFPWQEPELSGID